MSECWNSRPGTTVTTDGKCCRDRVSECWNSRPGTTVTMDGKCCQGPLTEEGECPIAGTAGQGPWLPWMVSGLV